MRMSTRHEGPSTLNYDVLPIEGPASRAPRPPVRHRARYQLVLLRTVQRGLTHPHGRARRHSSHLHTRGSTRTPEAHTTFTPHTRSHHTHIHNTQTLHCDFPVRLTRTRCLTGEYPVRLARALPREGVRHISRGSTREITPFFLFLSALATPALSRASSGGVDVMISLSRSLASTALNLTPLLRFMPVRGSAVC